MKRFGIDMLCAVLCLVSICQADWKTERDKTKSIPVVSAGCDNPCCKCNPCRCNPCRCKCEKLQSCPDGKCPKQQNTIQPQATDDLAFVHRAYSASARLSHRRSGGSATVIDCYKNRKGEWVAILMGCNHVVDYHNVTDLKVELFWPKRIEAKGYIVERDANEDLALMSMRVPERVVHVPLSRNGSPKPGDRVLTIGCPALEKEQSEPVGYFTNVMNEKYREKGGEFDQYGVNYPAVGGHSGGGVFHKGAHVGVLVSRGNSQSQVVPAEATARLYEKVFCEGEVTKTEQNEKTCRLFDFFFGRGRQPRPPYQGPPQGDAPDLTPEPPAPVVPEPAVEESPVVESDPEHSPVGTGLAIGIPLGLGALAVSFLRKVKSQSAV